LLVWYPAVPLPALRLSAVLSTRGKVRFDMVSVLLAEPPAIGLLPDAFRPMRTL
jgi:hypothetical protein